MKRKSWKKYLSISAAVLLGMSALTGCGEKPAEGSGAEESIAEESESSAESTMQESESSSEESAQPDAAASTDPLQMITEGYYSYTFPLDGREDMCAFFHFYEEQPVIGAVFYAGFAWNQMNFTGTYKVEAVEKEYSCYMARGDEEPTTGTAPYTVTFYDFAGNELGACGFDGEILYNDTDIKGTGAEQCSMYHDVDPASPYMSTYEAEVGMEYRSFEGADPTSVLTLFHNGRYEDMVDMMVEGIWSMEETADGYAYTLTPDYDTDTGAVVTVSADLGSATYTPDGGEAVAMTVKGTEAGGAEAEVNLVMSGTVAIPDVGADADVVGNLYADGTVTLAAQAFGNEIELDKGTWSMGEDGFTVTFQFEKAGELVSTVSETGAAVQYVQAGTMLGDIDTELSIGYPE